MENLVIDLYQRREINEETPEEQRRNGKKKKITWKLNREELVLSACSYVTFIYSMKLSSGVKMDGAVSRLSRKLDSQNDDFLLNESVVIWLSSCYAEPAKNHWQARNIRMRSVEVNRDGALDHSCSRQRRTPWKCWGRPGRWGRQWRRRRGGPRGGPVRWWADPLRPGPRSPSGRRTTRCALPRPQPPPRPDKFKTLL